MNGSAPISACPACVAAPAAEALAAQPTVPEANIQLALPGIHCAACINGVERALSTTPGVRATRVNLSLKRVAIDAPGIEPETLINALGQHGYDALPLDALL